MASQEVPKTHRALVLSSTDEPPKIKELPTPQPGPGSVMVKMLSANILSYQNDIYNGVRKYPFPKPLTTGMGGIGRIAAIGPDTLVLKPGQLVFVDCFVRGRDDPNSAFLLGIHEGHTEGSKKLMHGEWRDGSYAEYVKVPLENAFPLNEDLLMGKLGYGVEELGEIARDLIPFGGLSDISLRPGQTIIIAPATGPFGMAAVKVALAMGTRVIAMGRNLSVLKALQSSHERVEIVQITGDEQADLKSLQQFGEIDAYFDISPPVAENSTHFKSCILSLRHGGRISLMGGLNTDLTIPHTVIMHRDLLLKGKWMYSRQNVLDLIKMVEIGLLKMGKKAGQEIVKFKMEEWKEAFDTAESFSGSGRSAVIVP